MSRPSLIEQLHADGKLADTLFQTVPAIVLVLDNDGKVITFNRFMEKLSGYTASEAAGWDWFERFLPKKDQSKIGQLFEQCKKGDHVSGNINPIICKDGSQRLIEWYDDHIYDTNNAPMGIVAIGLDITERANAIDILNRREQLVNALMEASDVGLLIVNAETKTIVRANKGVTTLSGYPLEEIVGAPCHQILCNTNQEFCPILDQHQIVENVERELRTRDGVLVPVLKNVFQFQMGNKPHLLETFVDLRSHKQMEMELSHVKKMESLGQVAAAMAHEINNPAQYVDGNLQFLAQEFGTITNILKTSAKLASSLVKTNPKQLAASGLASQIEVGDVDFLIKEIPTAIAQAQDGIKRITQMVADMKEFLSPQNKHQFAIDINRCIQAAVTVTKTRWERRARMDMSLAVDLPTINGFPGDLHLALVQLLNNAVDAIQERFPDEKNNDAHGIITVITKKQGQQTLISIADNGIPIPKERHSLVFSPVSDGAMSANNRRDAAICRSVVEHKHNGQIHFNSTPAPLTTFVITLPTGTE